MNFRQLILAVATALAFPIASHAQEATSTVTRAQVRAELVQLEKVGYMPGQRSPLPRRHSGCRSQDQRREQYRRQRRKQLRRRTGEPLGIGQPRCH
jgi:hypothetical protein